MSALQSRRPASMMSIQDYDPTKKPHRKTEYTKEQALDLIRCVEGPLFFMSNFMKVQHPIRGSLPFQPYPFQVRLIEAFATRKNNIALTARQMGKTTCAAGFLLWKAMFTPDTCILITANKLVQALEIMDRIRYAYENLPDHIRAGVTEYNKGTITFDNASKIVSRATSPDAGRGLSITLLYLDEFSFVHPNKAAAFWTSIQPVLSTGGSCIITSTPKNDEDQFAIIWRGANDCTDSFGNQVNGGVGRNGFFQTLVPWWEHPERDEAWATPFRESLGEARFRQEFCCITDDTKVTVRDASGTIQTMPVSQLLHAMDATP